MNRRNIILAIAIAILLLLALLLGPCVFAPNPVAPAPEPDALDESGHADPDSTGAP